MGKWLRLQCLKDLSDLSHSSMAQGLCPKGAGPGDFAESAQWPRGAVTVTWRGQALGQRGPLFTPGCVGCSPRGWTLLSQTQLRARLGEDLCAQHGPASGSCQDPPPGSQAHPAWPGLRGVRGPGPRWAIPELLGAEPAGPPSVKPHCLRGRAPGGGSLPSCLWLDRMDCLPCPPRGLCCLAVSPEVKPGEWRPPKDMPHPSP